MPIKRRSAKAKLSQPATWDTLLELERCFLLDEPMPPDPADVHYGHEWSLAAALRAVAGTRERVDLDVFRLDRPPLVDIWEACADLVLAQWIADWPGTRPRCWWRFSAPTSLPVGESEAAYLQRFDLLLPGEVERLTAEDFESDDDCRGC